ncbi:WecB/TagA/CpsF family glycosyltransferase [Entomospira entomophila]|uniref:Glycosyltransferase n=1 Tax=Entomospira entomophila TaxID=2719988 RepID=A0A968KR97_9SPIO|nr:WecB/TagA/CpsF family glycosyltransferase [Entomospira entomophilus]NIZ40559.1 hypothetical protein [Entomospira entomophilus]WDI36117.1 WecB/TagA/CpsF family glycosyltransferase [Entomospira entomophilus]
MEEQKKERLMLLGVPVDIFASQQLFREYILSLVTNGKSNQIVFLTYSLLMKAQRNPVIMQIFHDAALVLPAEPSIIKGLNFVYRNHYKAVIPADVIISMLSSLEELPNKSVYLLGGSKKVVTTTYHNLKGSYPRLLFVGYHQGSMKGDQEQDVIEAIRKASPSILIISKGIKKREQWMYLHRGEFKPGLTLYCRECFDVFCGKKKRPAERELQNKGGMRISRLLHYPVYGLKLIGNRWKLKRAGTYE